MLTPLKRRERGTRDAEIQIGPNRNRVFSAPPFNWGVAARAVAGRESS